MTPRVDLLDIPTQRLADELRDRKRCVDCRTEHSSGWYSADGERRHRIRCARCQEKREVAS